MTTPAAQPSITTEWRRLKFNLRAFICEWMMDKAMDVCPMGYTPVIIDTVIDEFLALDEAEEAT